jgi:hypothetical protein
MGYEGASLDAFIATLKAAKITQVADRLSNRLF